MSGREATRGGLVDAVTTIGLGLLLGARHAADPDHVAAIGALARRSPSATAAMQTGAWWGLGHACTVTVAGLALATVGWALPEPIVAVAHAGVGVLLVVLGVAALRESNDAANEPRSASRALAVGVAHGLAGSATGTLIAIAGTRGGSRRRSRSWSSASAPSPAWSR